MKESTILIGFAGVGKTYACEHAKELNLNLVDSDTSDFHWMEKDGEKIVNPEWPQNYIDHVIELGKGKDHPDYIMVATFPEIAKALISKFEMSVVILPDKSMKDEFIRRYKERGSSEKFINKIIDNFDEYIDNITEIALNEEHNNVFLVPIRPGGKIQNVMDYLSRNIKSAIEFF